MHEKIQKISNFRTGTKLLQKLEFVQNNIDFIMVFLFVFQNQKSDLTRKNRNKLPEKNSFEISS
jgi:hypothetical protein